MALPTDVQIEIVGHHAVTSDQPMDDPHSLRATFSSMRLALDRFRHGRTGADPINYYTLLTS